MNVSKTDTGKKGDPVYFKLYREAYFDNQDDGSLYEFDIVSSTSKTTENYAWDLEPGTYYLLAKCDLSQYFTRVKKLNICYKLVSHLNNNTIATASPLKEREWQDVWQSGYFSIGERKAGEVVQIQLDDGGNTPKDHIYVYDADGKYMKDSYYASFSFQVSADGVYYLKVPEYDVNLNAENEPARFVSGTIPTTIKLEQQKA